MRLLTITKYGKSNLLKVAKLLSPRGWALRLVGRVLTIMLPLTALFVANFSSPVFADAHHNQEYEVKAAFIYNFANFVEWPRDTFQGESSSLVIYVLGKDPFGNILNSINGKTVQGKKVVIRQAMQIEEVKECHILFVSASEKRNLAYVLKSLKARHVLTIGDQDRFCQAGGMINLVILNKRVGFEINVSAAKRAGIKISSSLLKLASDITE